VVDADCPLEEPDRLIAQVLTLFDPARDLLSVKGPLDLSDVASLQTGSGAKVGLDATRKLPGEVLPGTDPARQQPTGSPAEVQKLVSRKWLEYGIE
jgi:4-hydroxy-3-polyprenylbenzoate decarboxylase